MNKLFFENLVPGTLLFSRFKLVRCLNAGNMGGVYLCNDAKGADQQVVLKVLSTAALKNPLLCDSFQREVRLLRIVSHPNVVQGEEYFSDESFSAFSMEYVEGGSLAELLHDTKQLSVSKMISILRQLANGLASIHESDIIHRDLKPENILVDGSGNIKIADFGIAITNGSAEPDLDNHLIGTINYLSPEYIEHGQFDCRSDIYAFGVIAYEVMTGRLPFYGDSVVDSLASRVRFDPVAPRSLRNDIPRALSDLALRCMKRSPEKRYQNLDEIVQQLDLIESLEAPVSGSLEAPKQEAPGVLESLLLTLTTITS